jgi:pimeloyl-ACP methyl ester carboxylesterase
MKNDLSEVQAKAQRIELHTASGMQVWHVWNQEAGHPLVLLHGGSGSWNHWVRNAQALSQHRAVWALDTPGLGDSELPLGAADADDLYHPVEQGLQILFADQQIDITGFSFGGLVAGFLAATYTQRVKRLVLVGIPGLGLSNQIANMRGFRADMTQQQRYEVHRNNLLAIMLYDETLITPELLEMQEHNVQRDRLRKRRIARSDAMLPLQKLWQCPVYGIWGEYDALYQGSLHQIKALLSGCDMRAFHVVPDAGHWVQYERPQAFNAVLQSCLAD